MQRQQRERRVRPHVHSAVMISSSSLLLLLLGASMSFAYVEIYNLKARGNTPDAYVKVSVAGVPLGQTGIVKDNHNPWWPERFSYSSAVEKHQLKLQVFDRDLNFDDPLGICTHYLVKGTFDRSCSLTKGGTLYYSYTLS